MNWRKLDSITLLDEIEKSSFQKPSLIFKHSTRCSISSGALNRLERNWNGNEALDIWYLDLIKYRDVSNAIAQKFLVEHQSPQVLIIKNGKCFYHASHFEIEYDEIMNHA
ncbi:MAG: bacillithiol system redox-active protein YtxJ [Bacteroidia bacterium]